MFLCQQQQNLDPQIYSKVVLLSKLQSWACSKFLNLAIMRKRDKVHIDRKQHQFDRHQQNDDVPAVQEDPDHADREKNRAQHQIMLQ